MLLADGLIDLRLGPHASHADRFWGYVARSPGGCWLWTGSRNSAGYGGFRAGSLKDSSRKMLAAHRVAYSLAFGVWPPRTLVVAHKCDTPSCVNPEHLMMVTQSENVRDAMAKGRWVPHTKPRCRPPVKRGESNGNTKVSDADVQSIRSLVAEGVPQAEVARRFRISSAHTSRIVRGKNRGAR